MRRNEPNYNFVVVGGQDLVIDLTLRRLLEIALEENTKRTSLYNKYLPHPVEIMPFFARMALRVL